MPDFWYHNGYMSWIFFAIVSPALNGTSVLIDKFLIEKKVKDPILLTIFGGIIVFVGAAIIFAIRGMGTLAPAQIGILLLAGALSEVALVPYYRALSFDDASRIVPLFQIIPIFVLVLSYVVLGETLGPRELAAFIFIFSGSFLLATQGSTAGVFRIRKSAWFVLAASLMWALPVVLFKLVVIHQSFWESVAYDLLGNAIGAAALFMAYHRRFFAEFKSVRAKTWSLITMNEGVFFFGRLSGFFALALGPVALVSVLGNLNPLFVFLFGLVLSFWLPNILKEDVSRKTIGIKIAAIVLVFIGASFLVA